MKQYGFPAKTGVTPSGREVVMGSRFFLEVVQDFDGRYYSNLTIEGEVVKDLPEHVDYNTLKEAIYNKTGIQIFKRKDMIFERSGRKKYAYIDATGGSEGWREKINASKNGYDCRITRKDFENGFSPDFTVYPEMIRRRELVLKHKQVIYGDYVFTPVKNAFNDKTSYWISKNGYAIALYAFTPWDPYSLKDALSEDSLKNYINYFESYFSSRQAA